MIGLWGLIVACVLVACALRWVRRDYYRALDEKRGGRVPRCAKCMYDLTGYDPAATERCGECGTRLAKTGVVRWAAWWRQPKQEDLHRSTRRALLFALFIFLGLFWAPRLVLTQHLASVHSRAELYVLSGVPPAFGTLTIERASRWVVLDAERELFGDHLAYEHVARTSLPGVQELDLSGPNLGIDGIAAWARSANPAASDADVRTVAEFLATQTRRGNEELDEVYGPGKAVWQNPIVYRRSTLTNNGVSIVAGPGGATTLSLMDEIRSAFGTPSLAHSTSMHWWRIARTMGVFLLALGVAAALWRLQVWWFRRTHRRWVERAQSRSSS